MFVGYHLRRALMFIQTVSANLLQWPDSHPTHLKSYAVLRLGSILALFQPALLSWISQYRGMQVKCTTHICPYWNVSYIQIYLSCQPVFLRTTLLFMLLLALNLIFSGKAIFVEWMNELMNEWSLDNRNSIQRRSPYKPDLVSSLTRPVPLW